MKDAGEIRIAAWNVELLSGTPQTGPNPRSEADYEDLRRVVTEVWADIWLIQELEGWSALRQMFGEDAWRCATAPAHPQEALPIQDLEGRSAPKQILEENAWRYMVAPGRARDALTRLPLRVGVAWRNTMDAKAEVRRVGAGWAGSRWGVELTLKDVRIIALHLKAGCWTTTGGAAARAPLACARQWVEQRAVRKWLAQKGARIAGGDFNRELLRREEPAGKALRRQGCRVVKGGKRDGPKAIDHFVANEQCERSLHISEITVHSMEGMSHAPDHAPISMTIANR